VDLDEAHITGGGRTGIRTQERVAPSTVFKTVAFVRSATLPGRSLPVDRADPTHDLKGSGIPSDRRIRRGAIAIGLLVVAMTFGACPIGDPAADPGLRVVNRTDEVIEIFGVNLDGQEIKLSEVQPRSAVDSYIACARGELVARTTDGDELAHRGPFDDCNTSPWIIQQPS
jgi:hypothetical protein